MRTLRFGQMILLSTLRAIIYHTAPKKLYRYFQVGLPRDWLLISLDWRCIRYLNTKKNRELRVQYIGRPCDRGGKCLTT